MALASLRLPQRQEELAGFLFVPWIVGFLAFTAGPMVLSAYLSMTQADFMTSTVFVGLDNYRRILVNDPFTKSLANTIYYSLVSVPLGLTLGLLIALLLNSEYPGVRSLRTIYYLPSVVSGRRHAMLWLWLLNPQLGLVNAAWPGCRRSRGPPWLLSAEWAKPALILMSLWGAGGKWSSSWPDCSGVPQELYEAAAVDGAGRFRKIRARHRSR